MAQYRNTHGYLKLGLREQPDPTPSNSIAAISRFHWDFAQACLWVRLYQPIYKSIRERMSNGIFAIHSKYRGKFHYQGPLHYSSTWLQQSVTRRRQHRILSVTACCGLTWHVVKNHTVICSPVPSGMGEENKKKKKTTTHNVELMG